MLDEIVRSRPATTNRTITLLKKFCKIKRLFLMQDVFPGGWNSQIEKTIQNIILALFKVPLRKKK